MTSSSGCLHLSLPATRSPEELTLSHKLQLDGSLTLSSSSSLQASPRGLLPGLLPGPADKLTPKGPGQVCECALVCEVQGSGCTAAGRCSSHCTLSACFILPQVVHVSPEVILASPVPWRATPEPLHPYHLSSWAVAVFGCIPPSPLSHLSSLQTPVPHLCLSPPLFPTTYVPFLVHFRCLLLPLDSPWSCRK